MKNLLLNVLVLHPLIWLASCVERKKFLRFGGKVGFFFYRLGFRTKVVRKNLEVAFKNTKSPEEIEQLVKETWRHSGVELFDSLYIYSMAVRNTEEELKSKLDFCDLSFAGAEELEALTKTRDKPLMFLTSHQTNIFAGFFLGLSFDNFCGMGRIHKNPLIVEIDTKIRSLFGMKVAAISKSRPQGIAIAISVLRKKGVLMFACDQDDRDSDLFIPFFGRTASFPTGAGKMMIKYGCEVYFFAVRMNEDFVYELRFKKIEYEKSDDDAKTQENLARAYNRFLEEIILKDPAQYFWLHKRWKTIPKNSDLEDLYR